MSKSRLILINFFSFLLGIAVALFVTARVKPQPVRVAAANITTNATTVLSSNVPPWGRLETMEIPLGNAGELFSDRPARLTRTTWFFEGYKKEDLDTLLRSCNLTEAQWAILQQSNVVAAATNGLVMTPPDEFVWDLSSTGRQKLYQVLEQSSQNYVQCFPFRFPVGHFDARLAGSGLSPEKLSRVRSLTYTDDGFTSLADLQLLPGILTTNEFEEVCESLYRMPVYRVRLRITPDTDVDKLVKYWGGHGRDKLIRPLLESLTRVTNSASVNISYMLPPTARNRLYTYPSAWPSVEAARQDCFWTSLNFFRDPPDPKFLDSAYNKQALSTEYQMIPGQPAFGDVVMLIDSNGNAVHACVYLAEDFVFTKNGINHLQPWAIMKISDMLSYFPSAKPLRMVVFRWKEGAANT